jgi:hypothetical protein
LYLFQNFEGKEELLQKFGKYKAGKGCIYVKKLANIDLKVLKVMMAKSTEDITGQYPA